MGNIPQQVQYGGNGQNNMSGGLNAALNSQKLP